MKPVRVRRQRTLRMNRFGKYVIGLGKWVVLVDSWTPLEERYFETWQSAMNFADHKAQQEREFLLKRGYL